jgi:hypothetical protein
MNRRRARALPVLRSSGPPRPSGLPLLSVLTVLLAALLSACGIRATKVPTDFGPAPSRMPCAASELRAAAVEPPRGIPVQVFLLCQGHLVGVDRTVRVPESAKDGDRRVLVAQALLGQLVRKPSEVEKLSGYTTALLTETTVTGPRENDPADTLRLSVSPDDLASPALAQLVCTFSDSAATECDRSVLLGGPDGAAPLRYACTADVRARPGDERPPSTGKGTG